jgi:hypothetical protein
VAGYVECLTKAGVRLSLIRCRARQQQLPFEPIQLRRVSTLTGFVYGRQRLGQYGKAFCRLPDSPIG